MKATFNNLNLQTDVEKHLSTDEVKISKQDESNNIFQLDINDSGYTYSNQKERDFDYANAKRLFTKRQPN